MVGGLAVAAAFLEELDLDDVKVGDMVQWESNGAYVFSEPKKVVKVDRHGSEKFVFVEGSGTGIPIKQVFKINV